MGRVDAFKGLQKPGRPATGEELLSAITKGDGDRALRLTEDGLGEVQTGEAYRNGDEKVFDGVAKGYQLLYPGKGETDATGRLARKPPREDVTTGHLMTALGFKTPMEKFKETTRRLEETRRQRLAEQLKERHRTAEERLGGGDKPREAPDERRRGMEERRPTLGRDASDEGRRGMEERRPGGDKHQAVFDEHKRTIEERRRDGDKLREALDEGRRSMEKRRPRGDKRRAASDGQPRVPTLPYRAHRIADTPATLLSQEKKGAARTSADGLKAATGAAATASETGGATTDPAGEAAQSASADPQPAARRYRLNLRHDKRWIIPKAEWEAMHGELDRFTDASARHKAFGEIYQAEGGLRPDGTTVAGVTRKTLNEAIEAGAVSDPTADMTPADLSQKQILEVYMFYLDRELKKWDNREGQVKKGIERLDEMPDHAAAALADTLFREGGPHAARIIQRAIAAALPDDSKLLESVLGEKKIPAVDGKLGPDTLRAFKAVAQFNLPGLLDAVARERVARRRAEATEDRDEALERLPAGHRRAERPLPEIVVPRGEVARIEHFRFREERQELKVGRKTGAQP